MCYFAPNPILDLKNCRHWVSTVASIRFEVWRYPCPSDKELSLSLYFSVLTTIFPGEPVLVDFIGAKDVEVVVTTGAVSRAKLQSNRRHQQTNTQFLYMPDALPVTQPALKGNDCQLKIIDLTASQFDMYRRALRSSAPTVWNSLPQTVLISDSLDFLNLDLKLSVHSGFH